MMYWGTGMGGWGMVLAAASTLLFWGLIIAGVAVLVRYTARGAPRSDPNGVENSPQRMLAERFARGEIDDEEYAQRLRVLNDTARAIRTGG